MHKTMHYGILGGTFDPPHIGHLALAQEAFARLGLDRVWFVPTGDPPHKHDRQISPAADRIRMTQLAVAADERFAVTDIEQELPTPSFTVRTLGALRDRWGTGVALTLVLGWDMLLYLPRWHDPEGVVSAVERVVAGQRAPGAGTDTARDVEAAVRGLREKLVVLGGPLLDVSASQVRARVASGLPVRYLVPDDICSYIEERRLYASPR
jgi:nicotinate-nucleotide adenylyltransferase